SRASTVNNRRHSKLVQWYTKLQYDVSLGRGGTRLGFGKLEAFRGDRSNRIQPAQSELAIRVEGRDHVNTPSVGSQASRPIESAPVQTCIFIYAYLGNDQ
ncbi:hypothetical protein CR513_19446, partial [Mucuna pruriens]